MPTYKIVSRKEYYNDDHTYQDVIGYCLSPEKTSSKYICQRNLQTDDYALEMQKTAEDFGQDTGTRLRHTIIGFSEGEGVDALEASKIAQELIDYHSDDYQIVAAVHTDTDIVHIHMAMNRVSFKDGSRYKGQKSEYYGFENHLNKVLKKHGLRKARRVK